jgi:hypothetical protein
MTRRFANARLQRLFAKNRVSIRIVIVLSPSWAALPVPTAPPPDRLAWDSARAHRDRARAVGQSGANSLADEFRPRSQLSMLAGLRF